LVSVFTDYFSSLLVVVPGVLAFVLDSAAADKGMKIPAHSIAMTINDERRLIMPWMMKGFFYRIKPGTRGADNRQA
jgi:hypothetical protein